MASISFMKSTLPAPAARAALHRPRICEEGDVVLRRHVPQEPVRDEDVLVAIEVEVRDQRAPAPVRSRDAGHLADIRERRRLPRAQRRVAVVVLEHVAHELAAVARAHLRLMTSHESNDDVVLRRTSSSGSMSVV
jgi:hypothetical protein